MYINYKSDFSLLVTFEEGILTYPWRMLFHTVTTPSILSTDINTSYSGGYTARFDGESYFRAKVVSGSETDILIEFKDHGLQPGDLRMEWDIMVQSDMFEEKNQRLVAPRLTPITLVESAGDEIDTTMIPILVPIVRGDKGEPFTYDDFTAEQLAALKGEKGEAGATGERGAQGAAFTYNDFTAQQLAALKGEKGDQGATGDQGAQGAAFTYDDFTPEQIAALNQGAPGVQGDQGIPGEKGDKGDKGEKGDPGEDGAQGAAFTYDDFTAQQLAALKGDKGDKGEKGDRGDIGAQGEAFTYDDFTAEQLAVLKGEKGEKGDQGEKGDPGAAGSSTMLSNDYVTIDNNTIKTKKNVANRGNIQDALLAIIRFDGYDVLDFWVSPTLSTNDEEMYFSQRFGDLSLNNGAFPKTAFLEYSKLKSVEYPGYVLMWEKSNKMVIELLGEDLEDKHEGTIFIYDSAFFF